VRKLESKSFVKTVIDGGALLFETPTRVETSKEEEEEEEDGEGESDMWYKSFNTW
jgi:hypothetical protein